LYTQLRLQNKRRIFRLKLLSLIVYTLAWPIHNFFFCKLRYGRKWVFMCIKYLNNARLQKDHFGQKMTSDNTQQEIFGSQTHIFVIFFQNLHPFRDVLKIKLLSTFLSDIQLSLDTCNKNSTNPCITEISSIFPKSMFACQYFCNPC